MIVVIKFKFALSYWNHKIAAIARLHDFTILSVDKASQVNWPRQTDREATISLQ